MRNIWLIAAKEFRAYLTSPMAYIVTFIFLLLSGGLFVFYLWRTSYTDTSVVGFLDPIFTFTFSMRGTGNILLLMFGSIITMRTLAEEKKLGTWELLLTSPVRDIEVVGGKFLGSMGILVAMLALTLYYPILLMIYGDPDVGPIWTGYLGLLLFGGAAVAVGIFASSLTANQIVAAVVSGGILFGLWFIGVVASGAPEGLQKVLNYLSLSGHFPGFEIGIIDTRDIIYYVSVMALFLYMGTRSLESSRWS